MNRLDELDDIIKGQNEEPEILIPAAPIKKTSTGEDTDTLIERLKGWNKSCRDLFIDIKNITFHADDEDMYLCFEDKSVYANDIYFKKDPENPKDPKVLHASKQFCKALGVPHGFFMKNRPTLKCNFVKTWQAGLNSDKPEKNQYIARIRESKSVSMLRALVPVSYCTLQNYELVSIIKETVPDINLEYVTGDNKDDINFHARFLFNEGHRLFGDTPVQIGFILQSSELGDKPLTLDVALYDINRSIYFINTYGTDPFFNSKYTGIQAKQIKDVFPSMVDRIKEEFQSMFENVESVYRPIVAEDEALKVSKWSGVSAAFKKALYHQISECGEDINNTWDFAGHMSLVAKDFDVTTRIKIERVAGRYLNLVFPRN